MNNLQRLSAFEKFQVIQPYIDGEISLSNLAKHHSISLSTLKRWLKRYKAEGLAGLERQQRSDKDKRQSITPELEKLAEALLLNKPGLTIAAVHRKVTEVAKQRNTPEPSYRVVRDIAKQIDPGMLLLAQEGSKAYGQEYELVFRREASRPNEIWQADHTPLDIVLLDEKGVARKPWLTTIIDDFSRAICGYYLSFENPSSINTALALHQAIWRKNDPKWQVCGIPSIFYSDNGSDFKSKHIKQVSADMKIQLKNSIPGKPRGRGRIERFFLTVNQLLLMDLPGFCSPQTSYPKAVLTLKEFIPLFEQFIVHEYHYKLHSGIGMLPIERWAGDDFLPQMPDSLEQLDLLLLTVVRPRKVRRDGIHFQNLLYISPTLAAFVGEHVTIRYDPRDLAEIRVYHRDSFLCRAVCQELAGHSISLKDIIRARQKRKKDLRKTIAERKSLMDTLMESPTRKNTAVTKLKQKTSSPAKAHNLKLYNND